MDQSVLLQALSSEEGWEWHLHGKEIGKLSIENIMEQTGVDEEQAKHIYAVYDYMAKHKIDDYETAENMMRGARVVEPSSGRELTDLSKDELLHKQQFESGLRLFGPTDAERKAKVMVDLRKEFEAAF